MCQAWNWLQNRFLFYKRFLNLIFRKLDCHTCYYTLKLWWPNHTWKQGDYFYLTSTTPHKCYILAALSWCTYRHLNTYLTPDKSVDKSQCGAESDKCVCVTTLDIRKHISIATQASKNHFSMQKNSSSSSSSILCSYSGVTAPNAFLVIRII